MNLIDELKVRTRRHPHRARRVSLIRTIGELTRRGHGRCYILYCQRTSTTCRIVAGPWVARNVKRPRAVNVTCEYDDVINRVRLEKVKNSTPIRLIAIPDIGVSDRITRSLRTKKDLLAEHPPPRVIINRFLELPEQPSLLRVTEQ